MIDVQARPWDARQWKARARASGIHFAASVAVAALAALLVFGVWYPYPYREISGGRELFTLLVSVDIVIGPLITFAVFDTRKPWSELRRDLAIVALLQLGALGYGLWTVAAARPVHLVFEIDRFRVVHAVDIPEELLAAAPPELKSLPLTGPTLLATRPFRDANENYQMTLAALGGLQIGAQAPLWQPYELARDRVLKAAQPLAALKKRFPSRAAEIDRAAASSGTDESRLVYLPVVSRSLFWTALLDADTARPVAFLPLDPF